MKQFKTLLIKDFNTYKSNFYKIILVLLSLFLLATISAIIGIELFLNNIVNNQINSFDINKAYFILTSIITGMISLIFTILIINLSSNALNSDYEYKCALFHRNLPINIWKITGSRYIITIFGSIFTMIIFTLFISLITDIVVMFLFKVSFIYSILGILKVFIPFIINGILLGSLSFFFSAIFKRKAFGKGLLVLAVIHFLIIYLNFLFGINIPNFIIKFGQTISYHFDKSSFQYLSFDNTKDFLNGIYYSFMNLQTLLKLIYSAVLFAISTIIFKYKEITE